MHKLLPAVAPTAAVLVALIMIVTGGRVGSAEPVGPCQVSYRVTDEWDGGFASNVTVTNTGDATIAGWYLAWSLPTGHIATDAWGTGDAGRVTLSKGASTVVVRSTADDRPLLPDGQAMFSLTGTRPTDAAVVDGAPDRFILNGASCTLG